MSLYMTNRQPFGLDGNEFVCSDGNGYLVVMNRVSDSSISYLFVLVIFVSICLVIYAPHPVDLLTPEINSNTIRFCAVFPLHE